MPWSGSSSSVAQRRPISEKMRASSSPGAADSLREMSDSTTSANLPLARRTSSRADCAAVSCGSSSTHLDVGALGADEIARRLVEDARRAEQERLLHVERFGVLTAQALGGHVERLGDRGGIRPVLDRLLERVLRLRVVGGGDERIDELRELVLREVAPRRAQRGRSTPERLELVDHAGRVLRALAGVLRQQREDEVVDVRRDPAARRLRARRLGHGRDVSEGRVGRRLEREDGLARQHLVHHRPEGVEIGRRVGAVPAHLLGRDRLGGPEDGEDPGVPVRDRRALPQAVGPEVDQRDVRPAVAVARRGRSRA